jgi:hypothetical protein
MKLLKIYSKGKILNIDAYIQLQELDRTNPNFKGCGNEFKQNRDWWVILDKKKTIIAYCGSIYTQGICIFNRAWVDKRFRGLGIHKKLIKIRLNAAKDSCYVAITYTTKDNYPSANNLISCKFKFYFPEYAYGGDEMLYFHKDLN